MLTQSLTLDSVFLEEKLELIGDGGNFVKLCVEEARAVAVQNARIARVSVYLRI